MAALLDELRTPPKCKVCAFLLTQPNAEEWHEALSAPDVTHAAVVKYLRGQGVRLDVSSVQRHRLNHEGAP